jgi:cholesterol oxidase
VILLVMQTLDTAMRLKPKRRPFSRSVRLTTEQDAERPNPTYIPVAEQAARWWSQRTGGLAKSSFTEAIFNIPTTAHFLGGAVIGASPETGVVDEANRVFGYENLMICDGSAIPANPGVNPSLTITAMTERAMSEIPAKHAGAVPLDLPAQARPAPAPAPVPAQAQAQAPPADLLPTS